MHKIYKVFETKKEKTGILGLWYDKASNKIVKDNIYIENVIGLQRAWYKISNLFIKGEKEVFYLADNKAKIINRQGKITELNNCIIKEVKHLKLSSIKLLLKLYNGLTIYNTFTGYKIVIYY
jgi:hypothetical protein